MHPHDHHCASCCALSSAVAENMDEISFNRSLCAAASLGNISRATDLIDRHPESVHSDGRVSGRSGYTPLHFAAREGHLEVVQLLIERGAHIDAQTTAGGATPLHRAAFMGRTDVVKALLNGGADPTIRDADGQTALHKANAQSRASVASVLLQACPELLDIVDAKGRKAADLWPS